MLHNGAAGCSSVTDHLKKNKKHVLMDWNWGVSCEIKPTDVIFLKNKWLHVVCNRDYCPACCSPHLISGKQSASLLITTVIDWSAARSFQWVVSSGRTDSARWPWEGERARGAALATGSLPVCGKTRQGMNHWQGAGSPCFVVCTKRERFGEVD